MSTPCPRKLADAALRVLVAVARQAPDRSDRALELAEACLAEGASVALAGRVLGMLARQDERGLVQAVDLADSLLAGAGEDQATG